MLNKLKNLFAEHASIEKLTLIIRPQGDSISLSVLPTVKQPKRDPGKMSEAKSELQISSFVCKGDDSELQGVLSGGFVDLIANDIALSEELQTAEDRKKKAIADANKATEAAKKKAKEAKGEDTAKLKAEIESLKKKLEEATAQPALF